MKRSVLIIAFLLSIAAAKAQTLTPPEHVPLKTDTWEILALKTYKQNKDGRYVPYFPPKLKGLEKKTIELPGYIIPTKAGIKHDVFALSVLPVAQCQFCGEGDIPSFVQVNMAKAINFTDKPIKVRGTLQLNDQDYNKLELILNNAELIE